MHGTLLDPKAKAGNCRQAQRLVLRMTGYKLRRVIEAMETTLGQLVTKYAIENIDMHGTIIHSLVKHAGRDKSSRRRTEEDFASCIAQEIKHLNSSIRSRIDHKFSITCNTGLLKKYRAKVLFMGEGRNTSEPMVYDPPGRPDKVRPKYLTAADRSSNNATTGHTDEYVRAVRTATADITTQMMSPREKNIAFVDASSRKEITRKKLAKMANTNLSNQPGEDGAQMLLAAWKAFVRRYGNNIDSSKVVLAHAIFYIGELTDETDIMYNNGFNKQLAEMVRNPIKAIIEGEKIKILMNEYNTLDIQTDKYLRSFDDIHDHTKDAEYASQITEMYAIAAKITQMNLVHGDRGKYEIGEHSNTGRKLEIPRDSPMSAYAATTPPRNTANKTTPKITRMHNSPADKEGKYSPYFIDVSGISNTSDAATTMQSGLVHSLYGRSPCIYPFVSNAPVAIRTGEKKYDPTAFMFLLENYNAFLSQDAHTPADYLDTNEAFLEDIGVHGIRGNTAGSEKRKQHIENLLEQQEDYDNYLSKLNPGNAKVSDASYIMSDAEKYTVSDMYQYLMPFAITNDKPNISNLYIRFCILHSLINCF
jgi:hypothetical protein